MHAGEKVIGAKLDYYCWEEEEEECALDPASPEEILQGANHLSVEKNAEVSFSFSVSDPDRLYLRNPEKIELVQIGKDKNTTSEMTTQQFHAPKEKGVYYYSVMLKWNGDLKGIAIYAFSLSVR